MVVLKVIEKFNGKDEGKILNPGDTITTDDVTRVNTLVAQRLCVITSVEADVATSNASSDTVMVNGTAYDVDAVKKALTALNVSVAANAKAKGITSAVEKLSDEQKAELEQALNAKTEEA